MPPLLSFLLGEKVKILLAAAVLVGLGCAWLWRPERQVRLHQRHFLNAAENRDWPKIKAILDDGFRTPYGHDKPIALALMAEGLRPFFALQIFDSETEVTVSGRDGAVRTRLRFSGTGMALAEIVQGAVNDSREPFEFTWRRQSWKPWDWRLVSASHPLMAHASGQLPSL
ncbi:MAG: hypothetical protein PHQ12_01075 [Chthoniobacteraceae bacterium]|nr:hypothetical protein [Chthoniobacteraceae bacterium]